MHQTRAQVVLRLLTPTLLHVAVNGCYCLRVALGVGVAVLLLLSTPIAVFIAATIFSVTRCFFSSLSLSGAKSKSTGDCSIRRMIVPSENPASTNSITPLLFKEGVFSSFVGAPPASVGGRMMRTVALPV